MISIEGSISALERNANALKKKLEAKGFDVELDVFKTGPGGSEHYGPSYVELSIGSDEAYLVKRIHAGGYGDVYLWSQIKNHIIEQVGGKS